MTAQRKADLGQSQVEQEQPQADKWRAFVEAKARSDHSGATADIELAARAWTDWLTDFIPCPSQRQEIPSPRFRRGQR
jgi:hypothetical protein